MNTALAPLELKGVGTGGVESLVSFTLRLAHVHAVSAHQLGKVLLNDIPYLHSDGGPKLARGGLDYSMLCSYSAQTDLIVFRLAQLTGQDNLSFGTLLRFKNILCGNQTGALSTRRRWCPVCYADPASFDFEPLAWLMPMIMRCPIHKVKLLESCGYCGANQMKWTLGLARHMCGKCTAYLADSGAQELTLDHWYSWCEDQMFKLLEYIAVPGTLGFVDDAYKKFMNRITALSEGSATPTRGLTRLQMDHNARRVSRPRLKTLFQIAARAGTRPLDILLRPEESASAMLFHDDLAVPKVQPKKKFKAENYARCERSFQSLMRLPNEVLLPPAYGLCTKHEVSPPNFWITRRELWDAYMTERKSRLNRKYEANMGLAVGYAESVIQRAQKAGVRIHGKRTIAQMQRDIKVSKRMARSALRVALIQSRADRRTQLPASESNS